MAHESDEFMGRVMSNLDGDAERRGFLLGLEAAAKVVETFHSKPRACLSAISIAQAVRAIDTTPQEG